MLYLFAASREMSRALFLFMLSGQWFSITKITLAVILQKLSLLQIFTMNPTIMWSLCL